MNAILTKNYSFEDKSPSEFDTLRFLSDSNPTKLYLLQ